MRKYSWLLTALIVVAFFVMRHRSVPNAPAPPANAVHTSQGWRIPVITEVPQGTGEVWILGRKANKDYVVNVYNHQSLVHMFVAGKQISSDSTGTTYSTADAINLNYTQYQATAIHVNPDGRSGYIDLKFVKNAYGVQNQSQPANHS